MTAQSKSPVVNSGKPPYPYRTAWAIFLLLGNFVIAGIYFHILNP